MSRTHRLNEDGSRYYTRKQSLRRAFTAGFFHAFGARIPRDYPHADEESGWTRIMDLVHEAQNLGASDHE